MSIPTTTSRDLLAPVNDQLQRLRSHIAKWVVVDGLGMLLKCLLLVLAVDFLIDWVFAMDRAQRFVMLWLAVVVMAVVAVRYLLTPLLRRPSDDALCLQLERHNVALGDSLISALQLARIDDAQARGISPSMVRTAIQQGAAASQSLQPDSVLDVSRYRRNLIGLCLAGIALIAVGVSVVASATGAIWFQRNVLLAERSWPQDTYLQFVGVGDDDRLRVPRGMDWPVAVAVTEGSRRIPDEVVLEVEHGNHVRSEPMQATGDRRRFESMLQRVTEPLRLKAVSGRATSEWIEVEPIEYPAVAGLELEVTTPAYAGAVRRVLAPGEPLGALVAGSRLSIRGESSKPLRAARLVCRPDKPTDSGDNSTALEVVDDRRFRANMSLSLDDGGQYTLQLTDTETVVMPGSETAEPLVNTNAAQFTFHVRPDRAPQVRLRRKRIGQMVVPEARIPFGGVIDEEFGLTEVRMLLEWSLFDPEGEKEPTTQSKTIPLEGVEDQFKAERLVFDDEIDLQQAATPPPGAELVLRLEAVDNNDLSGPTTGSSSPLRFRVVTSEQLRTDLLQRESVIRRALGNQQKRQIGILADSHDLLRRAESNKAFAREQVVALAQLQKQQKQLGSTLASMIERLALIRSELVYNRLVSENNRHFDRLSLQVIAPLEKLVETTIPQAGAAVERARRTTDDSEQLSVSLGDAIEAQMTVDRTLRAVIASMIDDVEFQLVLDLMREIHGNQKDILKRSEEERRRLIREFLEKGGKNGNPTTGDGD